MSKGFRDDVGLLLFVDVGTGRTFAVRRIANALLEQDVPVHMTNFPVILNRLTGMYIKRTEQRLLPV